MKTQIAAVVSSLALIAIACSDVAPTAVVAGPGAGGFLGNDDRSFIAVLSGDEEVPPRATRARGVATFHLNDDGTIDYRLIASNIENVVAAHIHIAPRGVNGPVRQFLYGPAPAGGGRTDGILAEGTFTPTAEVLAAMHSGNAYVNVHTNDGVAPINTGPGDFPGGEVRGQIR